MPLVNDLKPSRVVSLALVVTSLTLASVDASAQPAPNTAPPSNNGTPSEPTKAPDAPPSADASKPSEPPKASDAPPPSKPSEPPKASAAPPPAEPGNPPEPPKAPDAAAQEPPPPSNASAPPEDGPATLGEVIVTARRRNEDVQQVPVALHVLDGTALEKKGPVNLANFTRESASVTAFSTNQRNTTISIRGLGTLTSAGSDGIDSGVGFYVDDVYFGRISQSLLNLVDIERVEVLRGPQGTLFGRNTTAGAISVITRAPSFEPEANLDFTLGRYNLLQTRGTISGPITDKLAARLSFGAYTRDGWLYDRDQLNYLHDLQSFALRGQLLYQPSSNFRLRFIADYTKQSSACCQSVTIGYATTFDNGAPISRPFLQRAAEFGYVPPAVNPSAREVDSDRQRSFRVGLGGASLRADWDVSPDNTITSISAGRFWNTSPRNDADGTPLDITVEGNGDDRQWQVSEELRLASARKRAIEYVGGLYFFYQKNAVQSRTEFGKDAGEWYIAPGANGLTTQQRRDALNGAFVYRPTTYDGLNAAAFGQGTWHILPVLDLTVGLRYTFERQTGSYASIQGSKFADVQLNDAQIAVRNNYVPATPYFELEHSWTNLSGVGTGVVHLGKDAIFYGTYSRGSKSGGLNLTGLAKVLQDAGYGIVKPEKVDHFEAGIKSQWFEHRLTANVTAFRTQVSDLQIPTQDVSFNPPRRYLGNVATVRSQGVELELQTRPIKAISVYASGTFNPVEYVSYTSAPCPFELRAPGQPTVCDLSGRTSALAPKYAASAGATYTLDLTDGLAGYLGADYSYRSSFYSSFDLSRYSRIPQTSLLNARIGLKDRNGRWDAQIWSTNLLDSLYWLSKTIDTETGRITGQLGEPRMYGATFRYNFL